MSRRAPAAPPRPIATPAARGRRAAPNRRPVLVGQGKPLEHRHDTEDGQPGAPLEHVDSRLEQRSITPELVDHDAPHARPVLIGKKGEGAYDLGENPSRIDVGDEDNRRAEVSRDRHVDDIRIGEVDLRRASRPLDDDEIGLGAQAGASADNGLPEEGFMTVILGRAQGRVGLPHQDHL